MSNKGMKVYRQGKTKGGDLNKTEQLYADMLELRRLGSDIVSWEREPLSFKIGDGMRTARYKPDFGVEHKDYYEVVEVKGGLILAGSKVKFRAAVKQYPWLKWSMVQFYKGKWSRIEGN